MARAPVPKEATSGPVVEFSLTKCPIYWPLLVPPMVTHSSHQLGFRQNFATSLSPDMLHAMLQTSLPVPLEPGQKILFITIIIIIYLLLAARATKSKTEGIRLHYTALACITPNERMTGTGWQQSAHAHGKHRRAVF